MLLRHRAGGNLAYFIDPMGDEFKKAIEEAMKKMEEEERESAEKSLKSTRRTRRKKGEKTKSSSNHLSRSVKKSLR
jgi:TRAP-type C4-dicarboxylate transport system substrate-binding protein